MIRRPAVVAVAGLVALAVAMGIGRFAFTPILPMMQLDAGLSNGSFREALVIASVALAASAAVLAWSPGLPATEPAPPPPSSA